MCRISFIVTFATVDIVKIEKFDDIGREYLSSPQSVYFILHQRFLAWGRYGKGLINSNQVNKT